MDLRWSKLSHLVFEGSACMGTRRVILKGLGMFSLASASLMLPWPAHAKLSEREKAKKRQEVLNMASKTLNRLYRAQPKSRSAIAKAAGHAVFSNFGMKILVAGGGSGDGVVFDTRNKRQTFMKMVEVQAGLGFGIKSFSVIFVFETASAVHQFINAGWEFGGQSTAAATYEGTGASLAGAVSVAPGVWMYQLTDKGLALELTAKGTKYYKNSDLN